MSVGKRIYLKRNMPDPEVIEGFKSIPASNTADCMNRDCAMNPRIHLVSSRIYYCFNLAWLLEASNTSERSN